MPDPGNQQGDPFGDVPMDDVGGGSPGDAPQSPRRAASAQFVVDSEVGAEAAMREAMDPANQSLADALRLSFRVLQGVIVVLVVLFVFSGVQTIEQGQSGVQLWFGKIVGAPGRQALEPGLRWSWLPYPAGEIVLLETANREVDLENRYWPNMPGTQTLQDAIASAIAGLGLNPAKDGFLVLRGGDLAHLKMNAKYQVDSPEKLLALVNPERASKLVELALDRATVQISATLDVEALVTMSDETKGRIRAAAQDMLDAAGAGVTITELNVPDKLPAFAIAQVQGDLQAATTEAQKMIEDAQQRAAEQLIRTAGPNYEQFARAIQRYEDATDRGREAEAAQAVARLGELVEGPLAAGEVVETIRRAQSYESEIESTLGVQARLFNSLLAAYRSDPRLVVTQHWYEAYSDVLNHRDTEVVFVPYDVGGATISFEGLEDAARARQDVRLKGAAASVNQQMMDLTRSFNPFSNEMAEPGKAGSRGVATPTGFATPGEARQQGLQRPRKNP